ncbi:hypothetical protein OF117_05830 [Geodermatophilus sp. YIM 151500]|uniref:hypothetical protein n=1 Tax=Geodermatophilus sp. YIM 151500 TaxID=2984531 RepID=UPI0021E4FC86|nr:hypothetical protein [Geodermatophilus sp. YIM 151500]MCV2488876.1 hypothetical protein [Geodermatophilus sp. YIM 151500]
MPEDVESSSEGTTVRGHLHLVPAAEKQLFVMRRSSHMVMYTDKSHLELAAEQGVRFLGEHLVAPGPAGA